MAIIRGFNPVWSFVDLQGNQADDTFYLYVLENQIPYIPAVVYHDPAGTIPWNNPIQLLANGTLPIDVYWDDTQVYRLELRQNIGPLPPSQADPLIYLVENYIPGGELDIPVNTTNSDTGNQITNAQFSIINFTSPYVLADTNPNPIEVGPGWFLDLVGTGTLTLARLPLNNVLANPTNAPYALRINVGGGWTSVSLRQRLQQNGMLWAGKNVSTSFTARIENASQNVSARLLASNGATVAILTNAALTNNFVEYTGFFTLPPAMNPDLPPAAYIDYVITLPTVSDIYITSLQLVQSTLAGAVPYEEDTINRQIDHTFNYYKPFLEYKPIPSYLTAWDFPLNPAQFGVAVGPVATGNNKSFYAWDQTIVFQTVTNGVTVDSGPSGGIKLTAALQTQMGIIQYLDAVQAREILSGRSSVGIRGFCSSGAQVCTLSLWATNAANLPDLKTPNFNSIVATIDGNGAVLTFNGAGWVGLERNNPGFSQFTLTDTPTDINFTGWVDNTAIPRVNDATFFAIVICTDVVALNDTVTFDWISLNAGDIATRPAPQTPDQVLRECQRYYEKSYDANVLPTTVTDVGVRSRGQLFYFDNPVTSGIFASASFDIPFASEKRTAASVVDLYSNVTGTIANVRGAVVINGVTTDLDLVAATFWTATGVNTKSIAYIGNGGGGAVFGAYGGGTPAITSYIAFHYVADARLGVVN